MFITEKPFTYPNFRILIRGDVLIRVETIWYMFMLDGVQMFNKLQGTLTINQLLNVISFTPGILNYYQVLKI